MISAGLFDNEDWNNDAENSALITGINYIWKSITIKKLFSEIVIIYHNITVYTVFNCILIK